MENNEYLYRTSVNFARRPYARVLELVQASLSSGTQELSRLHPEEMSADDVFKLKKRIEAVLSDNKVTAEGYESVSALIEDLYNSMVQYDVLTPYLRPETYERMGIEEIYGRWDSIYLLTKSGKLRLERGFPSPQKALDILNKMCDRFNANINEGTPTALGEFRPNIRISVVSSPISPAELGPEFNIRIVHGSEITRELLLKKHTINEQALDFLEECMRRRVNICIAGATGSGKTGTMYYLLSSITQDSGKRVGTIEIESREFDLVRRNPQGQVCNDVFSWVTRESDSQRYNINASDLVEIVLRFKPDIVGIGEMRNAEALMACEVGITGHGVITTTHADSARAAYDRIVMLCKKAGNGYSDETLYRLAVQAFPIIVYQQQCEDKSRRVFEILEGLRVENGQPVTSTLYRFSMEDTVQGSGTVLGKFRQENRISDRLREYMVLGGAARSALNRY